MFLLIQKNVLCRRSQAGGFRTVSARTQSNSTESPVEPWVRLSHFLLAEGAMATEKEKPPIVSQV